MKRFLIIIFTMISGLAIGQNQMNPQETSKRELSEIQTKLSEKSSSLKLSQNQLTRIEKLLLQKNHKIVELSKESLGKNDFSQKSKAIVESFSKSINSILTSEQRQALVNTSPSGR